MGALIRRRPVTAADRRSRSRAASPGSVCAVTTPKTVLPELDLARIRRHCEGRVPPRVRDQIRLEVEVRGRSVTIVEGRAP